MRLILVEESSNSVVDDPLTAVPAVVTLTFGEMAAVRAAISEQMRIMHTSMKREPDHIKLMTREILEHLRKADKNILTAMLTIAV